MWADDLSAEILARPGQVRLLALDTGSIDSLRMTLIARQGNNPAAEIRLVRGAFSTTRANLFQELSAALQFPYYFGFNWSAVDDLLGEMNWLWTRYLVLLVADAGELLSREEAEDLRIFFDLLDERLNPGPPSEDVFCMSLLLIDSAERLENLRRKAAVAGRELPPVSHVSR